MRFGRQWFPPEFAVGLSKSAYLFEDAVSRHDFELAECILKISNKTYSAYWQRQERRLNRLRNLITARTFRDRRPVFLHFSDFWPDMHAENCQLLDFIRLAAPELTFQITSRCENADIMFLSCYGSADALTKTSSADRWLFLGENVRPNYYEFDYSLSFDVWSYGGRNIYLPLWMLEIDWFKKSYPDRRPVAMAHLTKPINTNYAKRKNAVVFIGNNAEPFREFILSELTVNGIAVERFGSQTKPVEDKNKTISEYKVALCFENSYYPGYLTEKLIHAHIAGAHCLYWGGGGLGVDTDVDHICMVTSETNIMEILKFINRAFEYDGRVKLKSITQAWRLQSEFGRICSSIRRLLKPYILGITP